MKRRVESLLQIWRREGVRVERRGMDIILSGIERPDWFDDWIERHQTELVELLPDLSQPEPQKPEPERLPLPEDRLRAYNTLSVSVDRDNLKQLELQTKYRARFAAKARALEALAEYGLL